MRSGYGIGTSAAGGVTSRGCKSPCSMSGGSRSPHEEAVASGCITGGLTAAVAPPGCPWDSGHRGIRLGPLVCLRPVQPEHRRDQGTIQPEQTDRTNRAGRGSCRGTASSSARDVPAGPGDQGARRRPPRTGAKPRALRDAEAGRRPRQCPEGSAGRTSSTRGARRGMGRRVRASGTCRHCGDPCRRKTGLCDACNLYVRRYGHLPDEWVLARRVLRRRGL